MSLLSTLRPLSSRLYDTFSWILAYLFASGDRQTTLNDLNDDCLLLLLETLSLPQLLQLRAVSRRLCHLIEQYRLPMYKSLLYGYTVEERRQLLNEEEKRYRYGYLEAESMQREIEANLSKQSVQLYVSTRLHVFSEFNLGKSLDVWSHWVHTPSYRRPQHIFPVRLSTFPPSLPSLLPRLASLTFTHFLGNFEETLNEEQSTVNQLLDCYLRSSWKETLVALHLYIQVPTRPELEPEFFGLLSKLPALKHLNIDFSSYVSTMSWHLIPGPPQPNGSITYSEPDYGRWIHRNLLPNCLPVLSQLISFSLTNYGGLNTATILAQLGPKLAYLSLLNVFSSVSQYETFLASKPTLSQTLKTVEIKLAPDDDGRVLPLTCQYLPSLERALIGIGSPNEDIQPFFHYLKRLVHLREYASVNFTVDQFRAYRLSPVPVTPLPPLPTVRRFSLYLYNRGAFEESELTDYVLPLLASVFPNLNYLSITFRGYSLNYGSKYNETHSLQLLSLVKQLFTRLSHCNATYYSPTVD